MSGHLPVAAAADVLVVGGGHGRGTPRRPGSAGTGHGLPGGALTAVTLGIVGVFTVVNGELLPVVRGLWGNGCRPSVALQLPARLGQRSRISSWKRTARTTSWSPL